MIGTGHGGKAVAAQPARRVQPLIRRLRNNAACILDAYHQSAAALDAGRRVSPAAEWLLDNYHLVEQQTHQTDTDLPPGYYRTLPKLSDGPFAGYPRVFEIAWAYVAHTDSLVETATLRRFLAAYQRVQPLLIGELWAVAISLRIVLVENTRRISEQIIEGQRLRRAADAIADRFIGLHGQDVLEMQLALAAYEGAPLSEIWAAELARRLRGSDPAETPLCGWLEDRLRQQGTSSDAVVALGMQRQGATNVTMRNIITSLRLVSEIDWAEVFEAVSLVDERLQSGGGAVYSEMDFPTRNSYRTVIEGFARGSRQSEIAVADLANALARAAKTGAEAEPGYYLIGEGRSALQQRIDFRTPWQLGLRRAMHGLGIGGYVGLIVATTLAVLALALWGISGAGAASGVLALLAFLGSVPVSAAATACVNLAVTRAVGPAVLPGMELKHGIPPHLRTLVAVPVLLTDTEDLAVQIERLEVHHLASASGAVHYALVSDGPDAATETTASDAELIAAAEAAIAALNAAYPSEDGARFLLLHRRRRYSQTMRCWMGWERKRGKLHELNRLLRGATDTSFLPIGGRPPEVPAGVRYVITLDADTRLHRDTVRRLIGKMAHPLNRPRFDAGGTRVVGGHAILQPRVTPALPLGHEGSRFQQITSGPGGIDPYAAAVSDVYQDLFGEGSFTGKGIYDVDAFEAALQGRVAPDTQLSHDLFEGIFARSGFASDVEVIESFPTRYDVSAKRQHRWVRGDWQLWPWLFGARRRMPGGVPATGRWKMLDNLRRSMVAPLSVAALVAGWLQPWSVALGWSGFIVAALVLPQLLPLPFALLPDGSGTTMRGHLAALRTDFRNAIWHGGVNVVFLADHAWRMLDAITRTAWRLSVSRRNLLEWVTAEQSSGRAQAGVVGYYSFMLGGTGFGLLAADVALVARPENWPLIVPFAVAWLLAPVLAWRISQTTATQEAAHLSASQAQQLRLIARRTWRYFETFVTDEHHMLPPDNFQELPQPAVAHRTSPTNMGLYLLAVVVAREMGWIGQETAIARLEQTLQTMQKLPRFRGHFHNWYDTHDLRVLDPLYVSSVDSGNLAGHLIALANACRAWQAAPIADDIRGGGVRDAALLALAALVEVPEAGGTGRALAGTLDTLLTQIATSATLASPDFPSLYALGTEAAEKARALAGLGSELDYWTEALMRCLAQHASEPPQVPASQVTRLHALATLAHDLALAMDFGFLLDREKMLLSIGFSVASNSLDPSCYDLLASEARLASFIAIAKGDVATRHWFRLGRAATPIGARAVLISWSGSMFEYLMPALVMRAPVGSLLEQTNRLVVARQNAYGRALALPWGFSESAYNARDLEMTYQYSNFGVPGLGLKRGLGDDRVVAPYASGLATMFDPVAALQNFARLAALGAEGRFGFYEAVDFTPERVQGGTGHTIVRSFMAHHQGMTIAAIANTLNDGCLRRHFHAEPIVQATEMLLQERVPREVAAAAPRAVKVHATSAEDSPDDAIRRFLSPTAMPSTAHLLSNEGYSVALTPTGAGSSRWRDIAITRWRGDPAQGQLGSFIIARDHRSGSLWSASQEPLRIEPGSYSASFCEHHAAFVHRKSTMTTTCEVVVSAEDDAEARRVTLANSGRHAREIDLTSYAELALAPPAADLAHPAFSKLFVVTDYLPELEVIIATRRRRAPSEPEIWAAHLAVVEGAENGPMQFETDRARFIGRGRDIGSALALGAAPLSGTTGTVLDPVFSIRRMLIVPAGGMARVTFWTMAAASSGALLDLVDRHRDASAFARAETLAWTRAQVQLRHLGISSADAADYQRLAGAIIANDRRMRPSPDAIFAGGGPQSDLWQHGISGDLPIVVLRIEDADDIDVLRETLSAHEYWRTKNFAVDLVILNERAASYVQDLQIAIETAVRSAQSRARASGEAASQLPGTVRVLRADLITAEARMRILSAARVMLVANRGHIGQQLTRLAEATGVYGAVTERPGPLLSLPRPVTPGPGEATENLEFFNGTGGFSQDGREYCVVLKAGNSTPAPWINVIANAGFGFQVSAEGSGYTWAENSRENQLTPWSNDPVTDAPGEAVYIADLDNGALWSPTALPIRDGGTYTARHGFGYSHFAHTAEGIAAEMVQFVPLDDPVKITRLTLRNTSDRARRLSVTAYAEWSLGSSRAATMPFVVTSVDVETGAMFARNPWSAAFGQRVAFADLRIAGGPGAGARRASHTGDRSEFLGQGGTLAAPKYRGDQPLSGRVGAALDPCAALQQTLNLAAGASVELVWLLGQAETAEAARALLIRTRAVDLDVAIDGVSRYWRGVLGAVQVQTPDRAMDILLNGWLLYQTLACRIRARAGFYQASGAYGFRDQLQDGMALTLAHPELTRTHILRAASRQFPQGDVQHWWLPHTGQGVRTHISDDRVWLGYCTASYVIASGDAAILDEKLPFIKGPALRAGAHDSFFQPTTSANVATLFEHCARALDQSLTLIGANGMPLIGTGDWNDGMNRVGDGGAGTSVWLGWLLIATLDLMAPLADTRAPTRAARWRAAAVLVRAAIERDGWDGQWYRRGTFDDGTPLGSADSEECRIDSIAQSWAVLSGAGDPARARTAMASLATHLVRHDPDLALLFTPPFARTKLDPGYIKGYPPGLRENGGQYSHAAMWAILAYAKMGDGDAAADLFALVNPINHARDATATERYKVEPYVVAADVYSTAPHVGRGGWTWYTGSAAWMYRAGIEGILGLTRHGDALMLEPTLPKAWPQVEMRVLVASTRYKIVVENPSGSGRGIAAVQIDGAAAAHRSGPLRLALDGANHEVRITLGKIGAAE